ncbi:MAG: hypothetical protein RL033_5627 [Pseudomonadota bacterium]|jgi:hypothetical protein
MPGPACSLLLAAFAASVVEAGVGADTEVAAGRAPVDYAGEAKNSASFTMVPGASVRRRSADSTLMLSYTPRLYYRGPNALAVDRPLVLHQAGLTHNWDPGHAFSWTNGAQVSIGQIDYTAAGVVFDETVSSAVRTSITDLFRATGTTGVRFAVGPRLSLTLDNAIEYTTTLDKTSVIPTPAAVAAGQAQTPGMGQSVFGSVIPDSFQVRTHPGLGYLIGRDMHFGTSLDFTYQWFKDTARYLLISPDLFWDAKFGARTTLAISGGVSYLYTLDAVNPDERQNSLGGNGNIDLSTIVYRGLGTTATYGLDASLEYFFDPIAGTSQPRAGATTRMTLELGRQWTLEPIAAFYTVLKTTRIFYLVDGAPLTEDPNDPGGVTLQQTIAPDATLVRLELPITYQASESVGLSFGVRSTLRSRPITDPDFKLNEQSEVWAFVGLTVRAATSSDHGAWLPL